MNIGRIWQLLPKGGWAGGSPDGWLGGWLVGWLVTNFPDRVCDNKVSCKKPAHLDQKWPRNGCLKFFEPFWGHLTPKSLPDQLWAHFRGGSWARLGACDTPLEPYARWLQEYGEQSRMRPTKFGSYSPKRKKMARKWGFLAKYGYFSAIFGPNRLIFFVGL